MTTANGRYLQHATIKIICSQQRENKIDAPQGGTGCSCIEDSSIKIVIGSQRNTQRLRRSDKNFQHELNNKAGVAKNVHIISALVDVRAQYREQNEHAYGAKG